MPASPIKRAQDRASEDRLISAAPEMLEALIAVNRLISEAAMTGFNCHDGDWAERLFYSQQATSSAIRKALGRRTDAIPTPPHPAGDQGATADHDLTTESR